MHNKKTDQLVVFDSWEDVVEAKKKNPEEWGMNFHRGEVLTVSNDFGESEKFKVKSFGKRFIILEINKNE
jgi:hypothetical protein